MIVGNCEVKTIRCGPEAMLKLMISGPALAFASMIAWRKDPGPASLVFITENVNAAFACEHRSMLNEAQKPTRSIANNTQFLINGSCWGGCWNIKDFQRMVAFRAMSRNLGTFSKGVYRN